MKTSNWIILKLTGAIDIPWWLILTPIILGLCYCGICFSLSKILEKIERKKSKKSIDK